MVGTAASAAETLLRPPSEITGATVATLAMLKKVELLLLFCGTDCVR